LKPSSGTGSYGFRPGRSCKDALRQVDRLLKEGYAHVVDADLKSYFDTIPHDRLLAQVASKVSDGRVLDLIKGFLCQDVMKAMERWTPTTGTPQGAVISPLLANIYLHPLDLLMEQSGYRMVRYADDFVILCGTAEEAAAALRQVTAWTMANGLTPHPQKTRTGDARQPGQGFDFLGYRFESGLRFVRKKSLKAFKDKVRARTKRSRGVSLGRVVADLNPMLRGWFGYFKHAAPREFKLLTVLSDGGCARSCASRRSDPGSGAVPTTINAGQMPTSQVSDCSHYPQPAIKRDAPDEETNDWRAVCGRTASTVRREGRRRAFPTPIVFLAQLQLRRGCPASWMPDIADKFTQSAQGGLLRPGIPSFAISSYWLLFESGPNEA
jgi:hypothetical protein